MGRTGGVWGRKGFRFDFGSRIEGWRDFLSEDRVGGLCWALAWDDGEIDLAAGLF